MTGDTESANDIEQQILNFLDKVTIWGTRSDNLRTPSPASKKRFLDFSALNVSVM